jgi:hypothetical protein
MVALLQNSQRIHVFRKHFNIARRVKFPCAIPYSYGKKTSGTSVSTSGDVCAVRSPQNIEAVRQSFISDARRSARSYSVALGVSDSSLWRILYKDLNFHPYNMTVVGGFSDRDVANRSTVAAPLIGNFVPMM